MTTLLDVIARFTSNELLLRRWLGTFTSPQLAELADEMLDVQDDLDKAREELWIAIRAMVHDVAQAAAVDFPEIASESLDMAIEVIYGFVVAQRRSHRKQEREAAHFRLVILPLDGGSHDPEHLEIVARHSLNGVPINDRWEAMLMELSACKRPAIAWAPEHEVHVDISEETGDDGDEGASEEEEQEEQAVPDDGSEYETTIPVVPVRPLSCDQCIPLGPTRDEDDAPCSLYLCGCANDGTILVESLTRPPRAVPCSLVRTVPITSPAPQVEALRRADMAGLTRAP